MDERDSWCEVSAAGDSQIRAIAFTADGRYLVGADKETVRVWRVADGQLQQEGMAKAKDVRSIAVSRNNKWIAAGGSWGEMTVWDRKKLENPVFTHDDGHTVTSVDFSPDSTRLATASGSREASIWDVASGRMLVGPLKHDYWVIAAKFSPQGDQIATATFLRDSVRLYDSRNGNLLHDFQPLTKVTPYYNTGLVWSNKSIFFLSGNAVKRIDVPTGGTSAVSSWEWPVPESNYPCIVLPESGRFIVYSASYTVTFYDIMSTGAQRTPMQLSQDAHSIALSLDGRLLAIGGGDGTITIRTLDGGKVTTVARG